MKPVTTIATLFIVFCGASHLVAQQPLFAPLGAVWYYDLYNCPPLPSPEPYVLTVTEDTIINGKYCTRLPNSFCYSDASCNGDIYVHQEGSKVFVYETLFNGFQMLYDFSLQTGDSYTYIMCKESWDVDTVTIHVDFADADPAGVQQLRVVPNQPTWWSEMGAEIVKGVGGTGYNRLLFYEGCIHFDCPYYVLKCYETPDSINYPAGCFVSAVDEGASPTNGILLYPNPATDYLNIELTSPKLMGRANFRIMDFGGRMVKDFVMGSPQDTYILPIRDLPAGMYFLQYLEDGEVRAVERFVVQK